MNLSSNEPLKSLGYGGGATPAFGALNQRTCENCGRNILINPKDTNLEEVIYVCDEKCGNEWVRTSREYLRQRGLLPKGYKGGHHPFVFAIKKL